MSTTTVPMDDKELFSSATSDAPIAEAVTEPDAAVEAASQPETAAETAERLRDEKGRFASKQQEQPAPQTQEQPPSEQPAQAQAQPQKEDAHVPSWRLREVNEAKEAAERRAAEAEARFANLERQFAEIQRQQAQQQQPDWYADPNAAFQQGVTPINQQLSQFSQTTMAGMSELRAMITYGKDAVEEARSALNEGLRTGNPEMRNLEMLAANSNDPWSVIMKWHDREKLQKEIGGDLNGYKARLQEQLLNDPKFLATAMEKARAQATGVQPGTKQPVVQLPPSLNKLASAASPHEDAGDMSDRSLFAHAIR